MADPNRFMDDMSRMVTDAMGMAQGMRKEAETLVKSHMERFLRDMNLVTREEFEAVQALASSARAEVDLLRQRIDQLEAGHTRETGPLSGEKTA